MGESRQVAAFEPQSLQFWRMGISAKAKAKVSN